MRVVQACIEHEGSCQWVPFAMLSAQMVLCSCHGCVLAGLGGKLKLGGNQFDFKCPTLSSWAQVGLGGVVRSGEPRVGLYSPTRPRNRPGACPTHVSHWHARGFPHAVSPSGGCRISAIVRWKALEISKRWVESAFHSDACTCFSRSMDIPRKWLKKGYFYVLSQNSCVPRRMRSMRFIPYDELAIIKTMLF